MDIKSFGNKYKNKPVFMIGNGPSLSETPLDQLKGMYSFAMNRISLMYDKVSWRPSFFVCTSINIEREEWRRNIIQTMELGIPSFVWDRLKQYVEPYHFKNISYINCTHGEKVVDYAPDDWWSYDASQRVCKFGTSMLPALQIAIYMGFNPIYLVGCDLGFKPPIQVIDNSKTPHDVAKQVLKDPNHFTADYGTPGCAPDVLNRNMRAAHALAYRAAERIGVQIYNATIGGDLDVYPRVDLRKLLSSRPSTSKKVLVNTTGISVGSQASNKLSEKTDVKINFIDVGSAGGLVQPWSSHQEKIGKRLTFEPRGAATAPDDTISISACLWEKAEERNFYIYRGFNGTGSSLFMQNYDYVLQNFESLKHRGSKELAETWLERSLPVDVERIHCRTLDDVLDELNLPYPFHFLKIDAQGAEYQILKGGQKYLRNDCYGLQLELFVLPLYKGIGLLDEVTSYLDGLGFEMVKKYPAQSSFASQHECVFLRRGIGDEVMQSIRRIYGLPALPSAALKYDDDLEQHQSISTPLCQLRYSHDELVETPNVRSHASNTMLSTSDDSFVSSNMLPKTSGNKLVKVNLIDVGSAGELPQPWSSHQEKIEKKLTFEPREAATISKDVISISACLWETAEERNFYIYRGAGGVGSSLFMANYDYVLQNFGSSKHRGQKALAETWLERSLPVDVERIHCRTLDDVLDELNLPYPFHFLKIDAQGAEYQILKGGQKYLRNDCYGLQLELFVLPLYKGIGLLDEVTSYLDSLGFEMVKKYPAHGSFASQHECVFLRRGIGDEVMQSIRRIYGLPVLPPAELKYDSDAASVNRTFSTAIQSGSPSGAASNLQQSREAADRSNVVAVAPMGSSLQQQPVPEQVLNRSRELLAAFHNRHRGQRCVIIGNGPSLNKMDLSFLKNEITFGLNKIYLMFDKWDFRPTYYVSVNPLVIEQSAEQICNITSPKFLSLNGLPYIQNHRDTIFLQSIRRPSFSNDPRNGLWEGHTVTYVTMQLAYFMGFSEVILIGVDHYFKSQGPANKEVISEGDDQNHFHPHYFGKGVRWNLPDLAKSEVAYSLAKQAFEADGRRIVDATVDGHLTIFPKADYKQVFSPASLTANSGELGLNAALIETEFGEYVRGKNENLNITVRPKFDSLVPAEPRREYLVSAIVSTYNSERFLRGCLDDLEQQTIADKLEIIVVNSGSEENEETIVREYQQKYNNIVYIKTEQREGIYAAWNRAARVAQGTFLTNANTDDRHRNDALEIMAKTLQENSDIALVYGDQIYTDTPNGTFDNHHATEMAGRPEYSRERLLFGCCVGSQPMWRKSLHEELGHFDESLTCASDWDFWLRISSKYKLKRIPDFLGLYYYNENGIEHGRKIHSLYERYIVGRRYGNPYISVIPVYKNKDNPLVSVIMPAYNAAAYIAEAIESVLIQNYRNLELIVVDDGSIDNTKDIVTGFKDDRIKYFYKDNSGPSAARNLAISKAGGQYIMPLDADDMMTPDSIARHLTEFENHSDADLVYCDVLLIDDRGNPVRIMNKPDYQDRRHLIRDLFRAGHPVIPFRLGIRRSVFDKIGFYDEDFLVGEDYDMMRRFIKAGLKAHHLNEPLHLRRMHTDSLSRNITAQKTKSHFELVKRFVETFRYDELFPDVEWDEIPAHERQLHTKCLAVVNYLAIGQGYLNSNSARIYAKTAFEQACSELHDCLKIDPDNRQIRELLHKCELGRQKYGEQVQQAVC